MEYFKDGRWHDDSCGDCRISCLPVYDPGCESHGAVCDPVPCFEPAYHFRARDAVRLRDNELEHVFDVVRYCDGHEIAWIRKSVVMRVRSVRHCRWQFECCALAITADGRLRFRWADGLLRAPAGYFEAELVVSHQPVAKFYLYKPYSIVHVRGTEPSTETCYEPCTPYHHECCIPEVEQDFCPPDAPHYDECQAEGRPDCDCGCEDDCDCGGDCQPHHCGCDAPRECRCDPHNPHTCF